MLAIILTILVALFPAKSETPVVTIPPMPNYAPEIKAVDVPACTAECDCHECYWLEVAYEFSDAFTAHFNAIEFKRSKNGRSMVRRPGDKSFRFVKAA
ncbi:hypothetical protein [Streptomyces sp. NPDC048720]|uniref:hypothetical protein n=1 Tax=Streptomyces sp. NPDC048720 TaxID=3365588 RepID=UPI003711D5A6